MGIRNSAVPDEVLAAIAAKDPISGYTHNFYRYPARFFPLFAREVIGHYSRPGEVVLDPFMGGGTAIVEAIALLRGTASEGAFEFGLEADAAFGMGWRFEQAADGFKW